VGLPSGQNPYWTHLGGPLLEEDLSAAEKTKVLRRLLAQLPRRTSFTFTCDPKLSYADLVRSAFFEAGFEHSSQITYIRLPDGSDVLTEQKSKHRGHIKRAANRLRCVDVTADEFVSFYRANLLANGRRSYAPLGILPHLIKEALERGCGRVIAAIPESMQECGSVGLRRVYDAAIVYVWDNCRCYYWLSTRRVQCGEENAGKPHPDAVKLLVVKAMEHAQAMNLVFDADGVVSPGADHFYRDILGLRIEERRDVFHRLSWFERVYRKLKARLI